MAVSWRLLESDPADAAFHVYRRDIYAGAEFVRVTTARPAGSAGEAAA